MGKVDFISHKVTLPASPEAVFAFVRDLNNMEKFMPEQVINWQSTAAECEFDIKGMAHISLKKEKEIPAQSVVIVSKPDNPIDVELTASMEEAGPGSTIAWITLSADLSPIFKIMASGPLQNLVNIMAERLRESF